MTTYPRLSGPHDEVPSLSAETHGRTHAAPGARSPLRGWVQGWWAAVLHLLHLITACVCAVLVVMTVSGAALTLELVGLLLLVPALWGVWGMIRLERHLLRAFLGKDIGDPPVSQAPSWRRRLALDLPHLRALGWAAVHMLWGLTAGSLVAAWISYSLLLVAMPLYVAWIPDSGVHLLGLVHLRHPVGYALGWVAGAAALLGTPTISRGLADVDLTLARRLVGVDPDHQIAELSERMATLTMTRTAAVDSVEAERRRIERDLHDGPQQRMVSIAMSLGLARDALDHGGDPALVRELLDEAHASSKEAITEMRQVARGIVPPILTDRGLDAAVSALAARSPVPVTVSARVGRLDPTVEAITYFCVSEALTNVAKHAGASRATVDLSVVETALGRELRVVVSDDGRGGAALSPALPDPHGPTQGGTGLTGLRQRVAAVDGHLHVHSPEGGGTTVSITLPLRRSTAPTTEVQR